MSAPDLTMCIATPPFPLTPPPGLFPCPLCSLAKGSKLAAIANTTDCKGRLLAYEYGLMLIPDRKPQLESFDASTLYSCPSPASRHRLATC